MSSEPTTFQLAFAVIAAVVIPAIVYLSLQRRSKEKDQSRNEKQQLLRDLKSVRSSTSSSPVRVYSATCESTDAWEERRRRGILAASSHVKRDAKMEMPFGSSYYYAHNNSKANGGYKDGLRMEDYTMNGPRLLSRGGKPIGDVVGSSVKSSSENRVQSANALLDRNKLSPDLKRTLLITRYLWDDPGDFKGIATIRIDELPCKESAKFISWNDISASIVIVSAGLIQNDEGLQVKIETCNDVNYLLRIPKLYGHVAEVEAISKAKRLLVRLKKRKSLWDKENLKAWPRPQKMVT